MPSFLDRLFRRPPPAAEPPATPTPNPVAMPVPDGMPLELLQRVPLQQPRAPGRKGKRRTPEERAADHKAWLEGTMRQAQLRFDFERDRAEAIGVTHYRWRSAGDGDVCRVCRSRNGKCFALRGDPRFQHPGLILCKCEPEEDGKEPLPQPCRCYAEMIVPR